MNHPSLPPREDEEHRPCLNVDEQRETLQRTFMALEVIRSYAPRLSLAGCQSLIYIALNTIDCDLAELPTCINLAETLRMSRSGASRLLSSLSPSGRLRGGEGTYTEGYNLVETNDWIGGHRIQAFVLTDEGRRCIIDVMRILSGREVGSYTPHDMNSLTKLLMLDIKRKRRRKPKQNAEEET